MNIRKLENKNLALLLFGMDQDLEPVGVVITGIVEMQDDRILLIRPKNLPPLEISSAILAQAQPVPEEVKDILQHAEYVANISRNDLPAGNFKDSYYEFNGLRWDAA